MVSRVVVPPRVKLLGVSVNEVMVGAVVEGTTDSWVEPIAACWFASVTVTLIVNPPVTVGVQFRETVFEVAHPAGRFV
jgi:hypothetical protein